jgi:hypothetical protein
LHIYGWPRQGSWNAEKERDDRADHSRLGIPENELTYAQRKGACNQADNEGPEFTGAGVVGCKSGEKAHDAWQRIDAEQQPTHRGFKADADDDNDERHHGGAPSDAV